MSARRPSTPAVAAALALGLAGAALAASEAAAWTPQKPVELVVMAGRGGGADQIARLLEQLIEAKNLSPVPFVPINKDGGSGAEALRYLADKAGDDYTLLVTLNSFYTTPIAEPGLGIDVTKFTPIARMALDTFLLWVDTDRKDINSLDEYVAAVKAKGTGWKVGGTGSGQEDSILTAMMEAELGYKVTYVPFSGGGLVARELVDGQVDSTVNNPSEQSALMRAGKTKPLVQFTDERMAGYPDVPTARELGHDIVYYMQRSINGPPGMDADAQAWYIDLFKTLYTSEEWQAFCTAQGLDCHAWVAGDALERFHADQLARHEELIRKVGTAAIAGR